MANAVATRTAEGTRHNSTTGLTCRVFSGEAEVIVLSFVQRSARRRLGIKTHFHLLARVSVESLRENAIFVPRK